MKLFWVFIIAAGEENTYWTGVVEAESKEKALVTVQLMVDIPFQEFSASAEEIVPRGRPHLHKLETHEWNLQMEGQQ